VNEPQVGIRSAGSGQYSVAKAGVGCIWLMGVVEATVVDENLDRLSRIRLAWGLQQGARETYVATNVDLVCRFGISPHHAIRCELRAHARGLEGEQDGAIWRRSREVGPCHGRRVAHYLRAFDQILKRFRRLESWKCWEAV
jgi:hypothetical protein